MDTPEHRIAAAMSEMIDSNRAARKVMAEADVILEKGIVALERGVKITDAMRFSGANIQRRAVQDAMQRVVSARHTLRLEVIDACVAEGLTLAVIADWWGFSRQRVDRYVQELKRRPPPEDTDSLGSPALNATAPVSPNSLRC